MLGSSVKKFKCTIHSTDPPIDSQKRSSCPILSLRSPQEMIVEARAVTVLHRGSSKTNHLVLL